MRYLKLYLVSLAAFFAIDMLWLGLVTYATYDLTNLATLKDWPALLSIVDMLWGMFLSVSVSCVGFIAGKKIFLCDN